MINITKKGNRVTIEGHTQADICAAVSSIMYTCYNILIEYDSKGVELNDSLENSTNCDKVEIIIRRKDKNTEPVWNVMCRELEIVANENPNNVTYCEE